MTLLQTRCQYSSITWVTKNANKLKKKHTHFSRLLGNLKQNKSKQKMFFLRSPSSCRSWWLKEIRLFSCCLCSQKIQKIIGDRLFRFSRAVSEGQRDGMKDLNRWWQNEKLPTIAAAENSMMEAVIDRFQEARDWSTDFSVKNGIDGQKNEQNVGNTWCENCLKLVC